MRKEINKNRKEEGERGLGKARWQSAGTNDGQRLL